nr:unnamed protein product [Spirometra erinaceieuropaei]
MSKEARGVYAELPSRQQSSQLQRIRSQFLLPINKHNDYTDCPRLCGHNFCLDAAISEWWPAQCLSEARTIQW